MPRRDRPISAPRTMALLAVIALVAASCGVSRESSIETTPPTTAVTPDTTIDDGNTETAPPEPATLPDPLGLNPDGEAAFMVFADGSEVVVTNASVIAADSDFRSSETFVNLVLQSGGVAIPIENVLIDQAILGATLEKMLVDRGTTVSDASRAQARDELAQSLTPLLGPDGDGVKLLDELGSYGDLVADLQSRLLTLSETLPPPVLACARHILLETEAEAQAAIDDIAAGADFTDIAIERSTGPSGPEGGDLGCVPSSNYVPEFAAAVDSATVGTVIGPVQTDFGFHVIIVDSFEEDSSGSQNQLLAAQQLAESELTSASVTIDSLLGMWDPASLAVIPA